MHLFVALVSWMNISNKKLKILYLSLNKPFSFNVVWLGSENLMYCKNYHRNNYNIWCFLLLALLYCIFYIGCFSSQSTSLLKANSSCFSITLGQGLAFLHRRSFQSSTGDRYVVRKRYVVKHNLITEVYLMTMWWKQLHVLACTGHHQVV